MWLLSGVLAFVSACGAPPLSNGKYVSLYTVESDNSVLVKIDGRAVISAQDLVERLSSSQLLLSGGIVSWDEARDTLESILRDSLISLAADTFTLDSGSGGFSDYTSVYEGLLKQEFITQVVFPQITVTLAEADSFYYARPDIFTFYSQVDLAHIVLSKAGYRNEEDSLYYRSMSDDSLESLMETRMNALKAQITDSISFQEAAELYSLDRNSGQRGGRLGWIEKGNLHPEIEKLVFDSSIALREAVGPLKSRDGWHLFFIYDRHFEGVPEINESRLAQSTNILADMRAQKIMKGIFDSLLSRHPITYDDSVLMLPFAEADPEAAVAWAEGIDTIRYKTFSRELEGLRAVQAASLSPTLPQLRYMLLAIVNTRHVLRMCHELGVVDLPRVRNESRRYYIDYARAEIRSRGTTSNFRVDNEEVERYYAAHQSEFVLNKQYHVQQIILEDSLHAEFVRSMAESGVDFLDLAQEHYPGEPDIRRVAADLGYIGQEYPLPDGLFNLVQGMTSGDISEPFKTEFGFHVVRLAERKRSVSLAEARADIVRVFRGRYLEQANKNLDRDLRRNHTIWRSRERYAGILLGPKVDRLAIPDVPGAPGAPDDSTAN